jgi:hypothetical protein
MLETEWTLTVSESTEGLLHNHGLCRHCDSNGRRAAATVQGLVTMLYEEIQKSLSRQILMLLFFRIFSGAHASPPTMFHIEYGNPDDPPTFRGKRLLL